VTERDPKRPAVPADPSGIEEPHDILAADEFGIGTRDDRMPPDAQRNQAPHDILAAEEFAMPGGDWQSEGDSSGGPDLRTLVPFLALGLLAALVLLRRRG
jgi:MYXO-CTERM domain-containing protein